MSDNKDYPGRSHRDWIARRGASEKQAVGDEPKRRDVDFAAPLVDQVDELAIDVRIFSDVGHGNGLTVYRQRRSTAGQTDFGPVRRARGNRPFFPLRAPPIEACVKRTFGLRACE